MIIKLRRLSSTLRGIYGPNQDRLAKRMLLLQPDAAEALVALEKTTGGLVYSDIYRSAEASLHAIETKKGAKPPGYSAHGFGLAVDVAIDQTVNRLGTVYSRLLKTMSAAGWHCYRRDGLRGFEDWHFNYLGIGEEAEVILKATAARVSWGEAAELAITKRHNAAFALTDLEIQTALQQLKFYSGAIDGALGPLTRHAAAAFGRAWNVRNAETFGPNMQRTLSFVTAKLEVEEIYNPLT